MTEPIFHARLDVAAMRSALATVAPVLDPVLATHILRHVFLRHAVDGFWLIATDLDNWITVAGIEAPWDGEMPDGGLALPRDFAAQLGRMMSGGRVDPAAVLDGKAVRGHVDLSLLQKKLTAPVLSVATANGIAYRAAHAIDGTDLPPPPPADGMQVEIPAGTLTAALRRCRPCISAKETRYYLNGVYLECDEDRGGKLTCVATDGTYMTVIRTDVDWPLPSGILPKSTVGHLLRLFGGSPFPLPIQAIGCTTHKAITFRAGTITLTAKLIDGAFPPYRKVIPATPDAWRLSATVTRAMIDAFAGLDERDAFFQCITFSPAAGTASQRADGQEIAVPVRGMVGDVDFAMNGHRLRQMLPGGRARLCGTGPSDPFLLVNDEPDALRILMPMKAPAFAHA
jgi:hypothetical protein